MATIYLGRGPHRVEVRVLPGDPFAVVMRRRNSGGQDVNWDVPPVLSFAGGTIWPASLSGADAVWAHPSEEVDAMLSAAGENREVKLSLGPITWARGTVILT